jgi:hypothetical protein
LFIVVRKWLEDTVTAEGLAHGHAFGELGADEVFTADLLLIELDRQDGDDAGMTTMPSASARTRSPRSKPLQPLFDIPDYRSRR